MLRATRADRTFFVQRAIQHGCESNSYWHLRLTDESFERMSLVISAALPEASILKHANG